jgi:hypothetical protein
MSAELPVSRITAVTRTLRSAAAATVSPFTGTQQVQDWGGSWWEYEIEFATLADAEGRALSAFFTALRGPVGTFTFRDGFIRNPTGTGAPQVNGAGQSGNSLITDGWGAVGLAAGDFFSLGAGAALRLYQVTQTFTPSGGAATVQFVPPLRSAPADNAALNVTNPGVLLRMAAAAPSQIGLADLYRFTITAREAI